MNEPVITFENVSKSYRLYHHITGGFKNFLFHLRRNASEFRNTDFESLKGLSFQVNRGEAFGIIGRNGAGKSTALGLMAGILKPTSGTVKVKGRVSSLLELGAGFHPELTGLENILLNGILLGLTRREVAARMDEIIEFSGLRDFIGQPVRVYSSGMLARLGFSVVAHLDPEILLIDEILAVGDEDFKKKCALKMARFRENGVTMVFVSHSMQEVAGLCNRVMWLEGHHMMMIGDPARVVARYSGNTAAVAWNEAADKKTPGHVSN